MNRAITALSFLLVFMLFQSTTAQEEAATPASGPEAAVRVAHLVPGAPDVTILIDGEPVFPEVVPGLVTGYTLLPTGEHQLTVLPADDPATGAATGGTSSAAPLAAVTLTTEAGSYYTIVVTETADADVPDEAFAAAPGETGGAFVRGTIASETQATGGAYELVTFTDTLGDFPPAGDALVRVIHVSPDAPAVLLVATPEGSQNAPSGADSPAALPLIEGPALVTNLPFAFSSAYTALAADTYHLQVQTANGVAVLDLPDTSIEAGTVYTFYLSGRSASTLAMNVSVDALVSQAFE